MGRAWQVEPGESRPQRRCTWRAREVWEALHTSDELLAWGALRAAQLAVAPARPDISDAVVRVGRAPRCRGAVLSGWALGHALGAGRLTGYALMGAVFTRVAFRSDVHPVLIAVAGRAGLLFEPRWVVWALAGSGIDPARAAPMLLGAVRRGYDTRIAEEARLAFVEPLTAPTERWA